MTQIKMEVTAAFTPKGKAAPGETQLGTFTIYLGQYPVFTLDGLERVGSLEDSAAYYMAGTLTDMMRNTIYCGCPDRVMP